MDKVLQEKGLYRLVDYRIDDEATHPFALVIPGGGYTFISDVAEGSCYCERLNELGYSAFMLYYHVGPQARFPAPLDDVAKALRYIFGHAEELHINPDKYIVLGSSAGGHLVGMFGVRSLGYGRYGFPKPAGLAMIYPVVTMGELTHERSRKYLLGPHPSAKMVRELSLENRISGSFPKTYLWCGKNDTCVNPQNSIMLHEALKAAAVPHIFHLYNDAPHGTALGDGKEPDGWMKEALAFFRTEEEKALNGEPYFPSDRDLLAKKSRAHDLSHLFNNLYERVEDTSEKRATTIKALLGEVGEGTTFLAPLWFHYGSHTFIGKNVFVGTGFTVQDDTYVRIGDDCRFGPNVTIVTPLHPLDAEERRTKVEEDGIARFYCQAKPVTIGHDVWVGASVTICPGVTIGNNCVIGAGSVVTRDIPDNSLAMGVPCKVTKQI